MVELTGLPLAEDLIDVSDLPHTITGALSYRSRIKSFNELPKDKRPPRNLWDKSYRLKEFFDEVFDTNSGGTSTKYIEYNQEDVE
jgi:hypothetical protein